MVEARKKERSPSYPAIDLEKALQRAKELREKESRHFAPVSAIVQHWGYSPKSSGGIVTLSALRKYGLIEEQGSSESRQARISNLALKILLDERPGSRERLDAIQEAALNPDIHAELWQEFGGSLPSDENLRYQLRIQRRFSDTAANEFIKQFKRTLVFAKILDSDTLSEQDEDKTEPERRTVIAMQRQQIQDERRTLVQERPALGEEYERVPLRLLGGKTMVAIELPGQLSEKAWRQMMDMLAALKPGYVPEAAEETDDSD